MGLSPTVGISAEGGLSPSAGIGGGGITKAASTPPPSFTGPLDKVPGADWVGAWSTARAMAASMLGQPGGTIRKLDGVTNPEQSFSYGAVDGAMPAASITTFIDGNPGAQTVLNDNSGSGVNLTASSVNAAWSASLQNGKCGVTAGDAEEFRNILTSMIFDGSVTVIAVTRGPIRILAVNGSSDYMDFDFNASGNTFNDLFHTATGNEASRRILSPAASVYVVSCKWQFGTCEWRVNNVIQALTGDFDNGGAVPSITLTDVNLTLDAVGAKFFEIAVAAELMSDANVLLVSQDMAGFYGVTLS